MKDIKLLESLTPFTCSNLDKLGKTYQLAKTCLIVLPVQICPEKGNSMRQPKYFASLLLNSKHWIQVAKEIENFKKFTQEVFLKAKCCSQKCKNYNTCQITTKECNL